VTRKDPCCTIPNGLMGIRPHRRPPRSLSASAAGSPSPAPGLTAARPRPDHAPPRGKAAATPPAPAPQPDSAGRRDRACLRAVFHELGVAHRRYRARTGHTVTPALRAATTAFKQAPSLGSLVPVAAFLDELGLLDW